MELQGERVTLRGLEDADIPTLVEMGREPAFARWWPNLNAAGLKAELDRTSGAVMFAITHGGEIIGLAQYYEEADLEYRHAGIDLGLATAWQDRGLGTDTVRTLARHLVQVRGHHRIVIDPAADNARAIRCYEKVGFRAVGVMREYELGPDGAWRDGLLMDLLAVDLT